MFGTQTMCGSFQKVIIVSDFSLIVSERPAVEWVVMGRAVGWR